MSEEKWFSAGFDGREQSELLVRVWTPGDGVSCAHSAYQKREPCGPPVAVVENVEFKFGAGGYRPEYGVRRRTQRTVCAEHLAGRIVKLSGGGTQGARSLAINDATKKATEELVAKHWKQYQGLYRKHLESARDELLGSIPDPLKTLICEAMDAVEGEVAGA
ncbi:Uncharacterised protein [Mycobacteroides abscessus subsp. massiliense]|uniref:hypothetical protein n=1 Tax=Mycobacteroides abscessus TaxID=36809 RepID=UPI0009A78045|nr:hypothetical protein [Mycobacteroides abscessus]SLI88098.1 Uncharacterised protein [Mycobacteroides abscessus subsp. massiliense]